MIGCCEGEVHDCCLKSYWVIYFSDMLWDHIPDANCSGVKGERCSVFFAQTKTSFNVNIS